MYPAPSDEAAADWTELQAKLDAAREGGGDQATGGAGGGSGTGAAGGDSGAAGPTAESLLETAEAALALAREIEEEGGVSDSGEILTGDRGAARRIARSRYGEARQAAEQALELGAEGWRPHAVAALSAYYLGDTEAAFEAAEIAAGQIPPGVTDWNSMAVLTVFAEGRFRAIKQAVEAEEDWDPKYLSDVHSAYSVLLAHPLGSVGQVVWHYDFLVWLGGRRYASRVLSEGIERYPNSPQLHQRLRDSLIEFRGPGALEARYDAMLAESDGANLRWFAGLASLTAAEAYRRAQRPDPAVEAYASTIAHYDAAIAADESLASSADFNAALALAGRARLRIETGDLDAAMEDVLASFERADAAGTLDGMNVTPASTGQLLLARLEQSGQTAAAHRLRTALDSLDAEDLLEPYVR